MAGAPWFLEAAQRAKASLTSMPFDSLGPAARRLVLADLRDQATALGFVATHGPDGQIEVWYGAKDGCQLYAQQVGACGRWRMSMFDMRVRAVDECPDPRVDSAGNEAEALRWLLQSIELIDFMAEARRVPSRAAERFTHSFRAGSDALPYQVNDGDKSVEFPSGDELAAIRCADERTARVVADALNKFFEES